MALLHEVFASQASADCPCLTSHIKDRDLQVMRDAQEVRDTQQMQHFGIDHSSVGIG